VKKGEQGGAVSVYVSQRVVLETSKTKVVAWWIWCVKC
jgi:hypothetical protein